MKKMKKSLALVLSLVMLTALFTACGKKEPEPEPATTPTTAPVTDTDDKTPDAGDKDATTPVPQPSTDIDISEHVTLKIMFHGSSVTNDFAVMAMVNEYLQDKINATIEPYWETWGSFDERVLLAINGGDDIDMYFTCSWTPNEYITYAKKGAYARLNHPDDNLLEKYAPGLFDVLPEVLRDGANIDGDPYQGGIGIYAVPGYKDIATQNCWDINVDLLTKYGFTLDDIRNTDYYGFDNILATVKAGEEAENGGTFYPLLAEGSVLERMVTNSIIVTGDAGSNNVLSYYLNPDDVAKEGPYGNQILNKFGTDEYKKFVEKTREYYLAGYIDPALGNAGQANELRTSKQLSGEYLIGTQSYSLGYEAQASAERNIDVAFVPCTAAYVDTTSSQGAMIAVSSASKNKERSVMFLNLLNTDPYLMTLFAYGIEGTHYEVIDGEVHFLPERDNYQPWINGLGNVTQLIPQAGQGANFQEEFKEYYGNASEIPVLGFYVDQTDIANELAALANVAGQYALALNTGIVDPATELPDFLNKLESNGMQKVIDEVNRQLDEYLANK